MKRLMIILMLSGCSSLNSDLGNVVAQNTEKIVAAINHHEARIIALEKKAGIINETTK